jgi:hypothetical protein
MIRHSVSETAREGLDLLKRGAPALKHGRAGKPHHTIFTLWADESTLSWTAVNKSLLKGAAKRLSGAARAERVLRVADVVDLLVGRESTVVRRSPLTRGSLPPLRLKETPRPAAVQTSWQRHGQRSLVAVARAQGGAACAAIGRRRRLRPRQP